MSKETALRNILSDFDKETAVRLMAGRIDELEKALTDLSARIYLQKVNTDLPWLGEWQKICDDALRLP